MIARCRLWLPLLPLAAVAACSLTLDTRTLGVPAAMAAPAAAPAAGQHFSVTSHAIYGFWGLFQIKQPSLQRTLAGQLVGGKGVSDLRIRVRSSPTDVLLTVLTGGLIVPRAVTFEGVVTPAP